MRKKYDEMLIKNKMIENDYDCKNSKVLNLREKCINITYIICIHHI